MPVGIDDLRTIREWGMFAHRDWKRRSWTSDLIARGEWSTVWDDLTQEASQALVENVYVEALEDKSASAASLIPQIIVAPTLGTRKDRAEQVAQTKRRVFLSYGYRSRISKVMLRWYLDWYQHGAAYGVPWCDWSESPRYPFFMRMDPRQAYPLSHDSEGNLTSIMFSRLRRWQDMVQEYGPDHATVISMRRRMDGRKDADKAFVEELWYFDCDQWAVAVYDNALPQNSGQFRYVIPIADRALGNTAVEWLVAPEQHELGRCPVAEGKRETADGEYRGALDVMLPTLRVAHNLMARVLTNVEHNVYGPVLMQNVENPEDYGPGAVLLGTGDGDAKIEYARPPVNFEALQHIQGALDSARNVGKYPQQRQGDFGASIASAKGVTSVMGAFNMELAWAQRDIAQLLQDVNVRTAALDELWCPGRKQIDGFDEGEVFTEKYDPKVLFAGDYRNFVTFGGQLGLDQQQSILMLASMKNMQGMSRRTFMTKSGIVDNAVREENDIAIESISDAFMAFCLKQADETGNLEPLQKIAERIDDDKLTVRAAVFDTIKELFGATPTGAAGGQSGGMGAGGPQMDMVEMARSMSSGGVPGSAAGQPQMTSALQRLLPPQMASTAGEIMPGGTAA